jgi:serine/threonine-protein kinase
MTPARRRIEAVSAALLLLVWAAGRVLGENALGFLDLALVAAVVLGLRAALGGSGASSSASAARGVEPAPAATTPRSFGSYRLLEKVGEGNFGAIYRANDPRRGEVAIKICESEDPSARARFEREGKLAMRLEHPAILRVSEYGEGGGVPYLVSELLPGEDLDAAIARREPASVARRFEILAEVADALAHAHGLSIIHRDIKPSNIRLLPDGRVKVLDFGLARRVEGESLALTRRGEALGSAAYMSPEQMRGEELDARTDVFSFGVVAYELLTFVSPFAAPGLTQIFDAIERREPEPVWEHEPGLGNAEDAFLRRCLAKRREDRFADGAELLAALRDLRASRK